MSSEGDSGEKTEAPTARRVSEARKEGQIGVSTDFSNVIGMSGAFIALQYVMPSMWRDLQLISRNAFTSDLARQQISAETINESAIGVLSLLVPELLLLTVIAAICGAGTTALQTKFNWSWKLVRPKFSHLNPVSGLKRIFGVANIVNTFKSIAKLCIIGPVSYIAFFDLFPQILTLMDVPISQLLVLASGAASYVFWRLIAWLFILSTLDLIWQKYNTYRQMKMSKQEIKDEKKSVEGDEATRRRIMAMGLQKARDRMFDAIPTADVVVTNPTHLAVALSYSLNDGGAPKVVAKGRGHIAKRIRLIAKENGIPIVERKPLARALFKMVEVGGEIPYELFKAVAELLAYVYRIKGKLPSKARNAINKRQSEHQTKSGV